jgi:DNA-binding SARP family transcriptional activator
MTALFYSALHAVNAYLSKCHKSCSDHGERDREILEDPKLQGIYDEYRDLKVFSQNARYHMHSYSQSQFQEAQNCLNTIQDHIDPLI